MSLTVETGMGVAGAESYASVATIDAYWTARSHHALSATWTGASAANKEGAAREATAYLDAVFGPYYRGVKRGDVQGLLWPRSETYDAAGYPLPDLPVEIVRATAEMAVRALSGTLTPDLARGGAVKREKVGPIEVEYADGAPTRTQYGEIAMALAPVLTGAQPGAPTPAWTWR